MLFFVAQESHSDEDAACPPEFTAPYRRTRQVQLELMRQQLLCHELKARTCGRDVSNSALQSIVRR
jgi:hypothetical protein